MSVSELNGKVLVLLIGIICIPTKTIAGVVSSSQIQWIPISDVDFDALDDVGPQGNTKVCIGRLNFMGGIMTGKIHPEAPNQIFLTYKGHELTKPSPQFKVLVYAKEHMNWVKTNRYSILPGNALQGGIEPFTLEPTYICRVLHKPDYVIVGRVVASEKVCEYSYYGIHYRNEYEVLVVADGVYYEDPELNLVPSVSIYRP